MDMQQEASNSSVKSRSEFADWIRQLGKLMPYHLATPADEIEIISEAFYTVNKFTFP
ncbi:MAG: hypothetical protein ACTSQL_11850 [Promethearchaeota archaeon]